MYKKFLTTEPEGFPVELDKFCKFFQDAYNEVLEGLGLSFGDMTIISGMVESGSGVVNVTSGFVIVNNELVKFEAGVKEPTFYVTTDIEELVYEGGTSKPVLETRIARFGTSPTDQYDYADLVRVRKINNISDPEWFHSLGTTGAATATGLDISVFNLTKDWCKDGKTITLTFFMNFNVNTVNGAAPAHYISIPLPEDVDPALTFYNCAVDFIGSANTSTSRQLVASGSDLVIPVPSTYPTGTRIITGQITYKTA